MRILLLFLFASVTLFAQQNNLYIPTSKKDTLLPNGIHKETTTGIIKKMVWLDENGKEIAKEKFSRDAKTYIDGYWDTDTAVVARLFVRSSYSKLNPENVKYLRNYLHNISGVPADSSKIIVINYYPGLDKPQKNLGKSNWNIYQKSYRKKIAALGNVSQYWVYKYDDNLSYHHASTIKWLHDKDGIVESTFIPAHISPGSYIVILPGGQCYIHHGEYSGDSVIENIKNLAYLNQK